MISLAVHTAPKIDGASARLTGVPPLTATFFTRPSAKNPIDRPSGEKNGACAPSVPEMATASSLSTGRRYSRQPPASQPDHAMPDPSAANASAGATSSKRVAGAEEMANFAAGGEVD